MELQLPRSYGPNLRFPASVFSSAQKIRRNVWRGEIGQEGASGYPACKKRPLSTTGDRRVHDPLLMARDHSRFSEKKNTRFSGYNLYILLCVYFAPLVYFHLSSNFLCENAR